MEELEFYRAANAWFANATDALEAAEDAHDFDLELGDGMITLILPSGGTYVISRHLAARQIWLSSPVSGGLRFSYDGKIWVLPDGRNIDHIFFSELADAGVGVGSVS